MSANISLIETDQIEGKIQIVLRQTDYTYELAREKLKENSYDEISVIKSYLGIVEKKEPKIQSVNQEIYKQLRNKLNANMKDYQLRVEKGEVKNVV
jgi:hypothetical protein